MASIIFYGAGQNAYTKINQWIEEGLEPVCFVDGNVNKQYTYFNKWEILPLFQAITRYPDYELYCTQVSSSLGEVRNYLLRLGIPEERIKSCESYLSTGEMYKNTLYSQLDHIYGALQDDLSRTLFMGRVEYSLSHSLFSIYRAMLCEENLKWVKNKTTYAYQRYGLNGLWEVLKDNYPIQKNKLYLLAVDDAWNEYEWLLERFLEAMPKLGINFEACVMPYAKERISEYKGIKCIDEKEFIKRIDSNARIIIGFPGWCLETKDIVDRYKEFKDILFPIADTAHPQYIEPDIFEPNENEIFVDVGVYDLQNSIDFVGWAKKGYQKIYAFEPDSKCYQNAKRMMETQEEEFKNKIELVNKGLGATNCVLDFPAEYKGSGAYDGKTISVDVVTLDYYLQGRPVSFVKMDVEGAEMDVLYGMRETILRHKPKLAVCVYHKHEDIFLIASYLLELVPEYKFYIRHYNSNETETVLFCKI